MKLEQQVVSLEIAKRLKELGVKQESLFSWKPKEVFRATEWMLFDKKPTTKDLSAFTVAELGNLLPPFIGSTIKMPAGMWHLTVDIKPMKYPKIFEAHTEADARGKMLIYLLENKLLTY